MRTTNGAPATILLVEDDPGDRHLTMRALQDGKIRNQVYIAQDGERALDYLFRRGKCQDPGASPRPDRVLLDLNLPKVDGRQVLAEIKADPGLRRLAVVVLTTSQQEEDIIRSYDLGANSFITKPVNVDQFARAIRTLEEYWFEIVVRQGGEP